MKLNKRKQIDDALYEYYQDIKSIENLEHQYKLYEHENSIVLRKIKNSDITLNDGVGSIDYSRDRVEGGKLESPFDRQVEELIGKLENILEFNNIKILNINHKVFELKNRNIVLDTIIKNLDFEDSRILELRYKYKCSQEKIANDLNMSRGNVQYKLKNITDYVGNYVFIGI